MERSLPPASMRKVSDAMSENLLQEMKMYKGVYIAFRASMTLTLPFLSAISQSTRVCENAVDGGSTILRTRVLGMSA